MKRNYPHIKSAAKTIDKIVNQVMFYLEAENAFMHVDKEGMGFYANEVRSAVTTVLDDSEIIFALGVQDVNDKLDQLVDDWDRSEWDLKRKIAVLERVYRSEGIAQALDYYLQAEIEAEIAFESDEM